MTDVATHCDARWMIAAPVWTDADAPSVKTKVPVPEERRSGVDRRAGVDRRDDARRVPGERRQDPPEGMPS